ncbi:hypothetical protein C2869_01905 [Saccharobesus litoralis]|uniref:CARDB domain-containing protein n=1 Tax=Saccharobesus litoralis TaxID=2172099 RepID=A0A2S0VM33_9ALTE|nr:hypothetical protein [Saccharobesus litoralis]AWB65274.1 hypothetical protein C2869_01905 [Saccharobesus litoralis]
MKLNKTLCALPLLSTLALQGCLIEDSEQNALTTTVNLTLSTLAVENQHLYEPNDELQVNYRLHADNLPNPHNVTVDFYLVHNEPEDDSEENTEESEVEGDHLLGSVIHEAIETGEFGYHAEFTIPRDLQHEGHYWIMAVVDPQDEIVESNEQDNHPHPENEDHVAGEFPYAEIEVQLHPGHEFKLTNIVLDGDSVILDTPDHHEGTGDLHSDIIGHIDAIYHGTNTAKARFEAEILIDGGFQPLKLWHADSKTYTDSQEIEFTYNGEDHFFGFDLFISDEQRAALYANYDADAYNNVLIRYDITDITESDDVEHDLNNSVVMSYPLYFFEGENTAQISSSAQVTAAGVTSNSQEYSLSGGFDKTYGDKKKIATSMDLGGLLKLDKENQGAIADAGGSFNVYVFNKKATLFRVGFNAQAFTDVAGTGDGTGWGSELVLFGSKIIDESHYKTEFIKTWNKEWEEERQIVSSSFFVGPIPVGVRAGVTGGLGFEFTLRFDGKLHAEGDVVSSYFDIWAKGGVEAGVASAGITAQFRIFDELLRLDSAADLTIIGQNGVDPKITYEFDLTNKLDVIKGDFGLFAEVRSVKWCKKKKWGIKIKYPCGIKKDNYYYWFYRTKGLYSKSWTIFAKDGEINL